MKKLLRTLPLASLIALVMVLATSCSQTSDLSMQEDVDKMLDVYKRQDVTFSSRWIPIQAIT